MRGASAGMPCNAMPSSVISGTSTGWCTLWHTVAKMWHTEANTDLTRTTLHWVQPGKDTAAAFLETRRYAALRGATVEWSKGEGMVFDKSSGVLYVAMSQVR